MMKGKKYFIKHDLGARNDPKMIQMIKTKGWESYGIYWAIIELLYENNGNPLPTNYDTYSYLLHYEKDKLKDIIEEYDLFVIENEVFYSKRVNEYFDEIKKASDVGREAAVKSWVERRKKKNG